MWDLDDDWLSVEDDFDSLPFDEHINLTPDGFRWRTADGEVLTLREMETKHIFNSMKMCFNHLAAVHGGTPVWFNHPYGDYEDMARDRPELLAAIAVFFHEEIERRGDLPLKYQHPYRMILQQMKGKLLNHGEKQHARLSR